ncbi:MAG TPA: hypothetical protein VFB20_03970 [Burkholderiales bacterium]|nr:hypothetical protein [Burkholderiales bacterium]
MTRRTKTRQALFAFLIAAAGGALVWALSPPLAGHREPWDADGPYYAIALFVAGFISGGLVPKPLWAHYVGAVVGQMAYEAAFLTIGPLFLLGAGFLLGYSMLFLLAAALAAYVRLRLLPRPPATSGLR